MNLEWYHMNDLKKKSFNRTTWVPLWSYTYNSKKKSYGLVGYEEDYFGAFSVMFPVDKKEDALNLEWMDINSRNSHNPWLETDGNFYNANDFDSFRSDGLGGSYLLLIEEFETENDNVWYLDQDLLLGLNLLRVGDEWICPREDDLVVVRLIRDNNKRQIRIEIRAEHLRDYLCAKESGLLIARYHKRTQIFEPTEELDKIDKQKEETLDYGNWRMSARDIHEGNGMEYGSDIAVFQVGHSGVEPDEDVPVLPHPTEGKFESDSYTFKRKERRLKHIISDYWQNDWIEPSQTSPRVKGDIVPSTVSFLVDNKNTFVNADKLKYEGRWLWFAPTIVNELLSKPYGHIAWHTKMLGEVGRIKCRSVTFGVNDIGLIVVYAKDIARLSEFDKKIWASKNIPPEGGLGHEMHTTQVKGLPVDSYAPENLLETEIDRLNNAFLSIYQKSLFTRHSLSGEIKKRVHRFRATNREGLFILCKEITRIVIERFDLKLLKQIRPDVNKEYKSLKRIELLIDEAGSSGREIMRPLAGINELRHADSHLPSNEVEKAMSLIGIDKIDNTIIAGEKLIFEVAKCLYKISESILKTKKNAPEDDIKD